MTLVKKLNCAALLILMLTAGSCKKQETSSAVRQPRQPSPAQQQNLTIGFSIDTLAIERWQRDMDVFINKAKEMGADVIVQNAVMNQMLSMTQ